MYRLEACFFNMLLEQIKYEDALLFMLFVPCICLERQLKLFYGFRISLFVTIAILIRLFKKF